MYHGIQIGTKNNTTFYSNINYDSLKILNYYHNLYYDNNINFKPIHVVQKVLT